MNLVRYAKLLVEPVPCVPMGITIGPFTRDQIPAWLQLRSAAFAGLTAAGRDWMADDFLREFSPRDARPAPTMWAAVDSGGLSSELFGFVALGRNFAAAEIAFVRWLMVRPEQRRRGIGRALLTAAECGAWQAGVRRLELETHGAWREAGRLYEACGYRRCESFAASQRSAT